jgi:hypothetical protein
MKPFIFTVITLSFLLTQAEIDAQTKQPKLNQMELYKQFTGTWKAEIGVDSIEMRECREYGLAFIIDIYRIINGKRIPVYINNVSYDATDGKFKGFLLYPNGTYFTWVGMFTKSNYFSGNIVFNFMPEVVWSEFHADFINSNEFSCTNFNQAGEQILEMKFIKME